jgi:23S rRNA (adenine1618-N6)-methyltransferase
LQADPGNIFEGVIRMEDHFDLTLCNPPFHASARDAQSGTLRKLNNLSLKRIAKPVLNFGGQQNELWCEGGELRFVHDMILQSKQFSASSLWFSTLISKESNLKSIYDALNKVGAVVVNTIPMGQGNKISRMVAWTFLTKTEQNNWVKERWKQIPEI